MREVKAGEILEVKTGKYDANHAKEDGAFEFFTCALKPFKSDTFSFDDEVIILPGNGANVGEVLYYNGKLEAYQRTYVLHNIKEDPKYLFHFFRKYWIRQITKKQVGSATNYIKMDDILSFKIPLPPLDQQKKIAAILDTADAYRQKTKALIEKYDELTQSLFLDMFGDPVANPKGWEMLRFDELVADDCPLTYGIVQPGDEFENGIPCVRPVDLKMQYIYLSDLKRIDPDISSKFKRTILKGGEILLSVRGSVGVISIADESLKNSNVTRGIVPIWFDKYLANNLFFYYLYRTKSIQRRLSELSRGATLIQINLKDLRELKLIKPSLELQNQFAERVQAIEAQKSQAEASLAQAEDLFNSLLQRAFNGELTKANTYE